MDQTGWWTLGALATLAALWLFRPRPAKSTRCQRCRTKVTRPRWTDGPVLCCPAHGTEAMVALRYEVLVAPYQAGLPAIPDPYQLLRSPLSPPPIPNVYPACPECGHLLLDVLIHEEISRA